ncbi:MAG: MFS transporter, partial [Pseudomonadota bacterium]|nr:MFS transporter [Pseudomonadota bacterium]
LLTAGNASGQLVFLPLLASLAQSPLGWRSVPWTAALAIVALLPVVALFVAESPGSLGLRPFGAVTPVGAPMGAFIGAAAPERRAEGNPFRVAVEGLLRGIRSVDFWLLAGSFGICGFSTYGLVITHFIPYCADHGVGPVTAAGLLAAIGVFDLFGTTGSGWLTDRVDSRRLLFWYYGLRGLSLLWLPFSGFDMLSLSVFAIFFGLDFVATIPPTVALTTQVFGQRDGPVAVSWIVAAHQVGGSLAAIGAGEARSLTGSYMLAFAGSGVLCLVASLLVLRIASRPAGAAVA